MAHGTLDDLISSGALRGFERRDLADGTRPVLVVGPMNSGRTSLALALARARDGRAAVVRGDGSPAYVSAGLREVDGRRGVAEAMRANASCIVFDEPVRREDAEAAEDVLNAGTVGLAAILVVHCADGADPGSRLRALGVSGEALRRARPLVVRCAQQGGPGTGVSYRQG